MSLNKITAEDIAANGVQSAPDTLTGTAAENKAVFDKLIANDTGSVKKRFNDLIDALEATTSPTGASQIGASVTGIEGSNIQSIISALKTLIDVVDGNAVKYVSQTRTEEEKDIARNNIGVSMSQVAVNYVNGKTGDVTIDKTDIGLGNCDNTSDANKPVSTATSTALGLKINTSDIVDNLTTDDSTKPLSAKQGKALNDAKSNTGHTHDDRYYTEIETNQLLNGKSNTGHTHDDRYYTESEVISLLGGVGMKRYTGSIWIGGDGYAYIGTTSGMFGISDHTRILGIVATSRTCTTARIQIDISGTDVFAFGNANTSYTYGAVCFYSL